MYKISLDFFLQNSNIAFRHRPKCNASNLFKTCTILNVNSVETYLARGNKVIDLNQTQDPLSVSRINLTRKKKREKSIYILREKNRKYAFLKV